jgi:hypothetical protein
MKSLAIVLALSSALAACSTTSDVYTKQVSATQDRQDRLAEIAIDKAPDWMSKLPKSPNAVYENGTAVSMDFGMADMKSRTIAYAKICTAAGGKVRSQTKIYRSDTDTTSTEASELAVRSICPDVDITGVETVGMKHVSEGNRIRTYVLVTLPLGDKNVLKSTRDAQARAPEAFKELDEVTGTKKPVEVVPVAPQRGNEVSVAQPDGTVSTLNLMPVENAEYRARREEALKKPGAVIGQVSIAN